MKTEGYGIEIRAVKWKGKGRKFREVKIAASWDGGYKSRRDALAAFAELSGLKLREHRTRVTKDLALVK